ncbi:MAG: YihY/virulence factor BrkB family protein [Eubacterium aggregans]
MKKNFNLEAVKDSVLYIIDDLYDTDFLGVCTQMAFYFLLAFFPMVIFLINFVGKIIVHFDQYIFEFLRAYMPQLSYDYVVNLTVMLENNIKENSVLLPILTFIFASMAARAIMVGINQSYGCEERRSLPKVWLLAFAITLLFGIALILIVTSYVLLSDVSTHLLNALGLAVVSAFLTKLISFCLAVLITILALYCIYTLAPTKRSSFKESLPGAILATVGMLMVFRIFVIFVDHSSRYTMLYGSLVSLFTLLVAIYFICVILNIYSKINVYWQDYFKNREHSEQS